MSITQSQGGPFGVYEDVIYN